MIDIAAEKEFENEIKEWLKSQGAWYIKYWAGSKFTKKGVPDLLCCFRGRFLGIEVKGEKGKPTEEQLDTIEQIRAAQGQAIVLYPAGFSRFKRWALSNFEFDIPVIVK